MAGGDEASELPPVADAAAGDAAAGDHTEIHGGGVGEEASTNPASSSPCFDISEFLGTPRKDSSSGGGGGVGGGGNNTGDEVFSNLSGLNLSPSSFQMLEVPEADFSALLLYQQQHRGGEYPDNTPLFGCCSTGGEDDTLVNNSTVVPSFLHHVHHHHHHPTSSSSAAANMFGQHGSFLAGESLGSGGGTAAGAGGGGEDHLEGSVATLGDASFAAAGAPGTANEWGVLCEGAAHHHHLHHHHLHHSLVNTVQQHSALQCDSCQILRCIIHSNGVQDTKLEIHGCDNISYHAVLHTRFCIDDGFPTALEQQMVEFPVGNAEYVRQFLLQYSLLRRKEGFVLRHDSLSTGVDQGSGYSFVPERSFNPSGSYLSKQIGPDYSNSVGGYGKSGPTKLGAPDGSDQGEPSGAPAKPPKSNAAAQRERTGKLKMSDLAQHFHLPINAAAKELGICPTVLKKICRRNGMRRWPHRKIKSIERIIATLEQTIAEGAGQGDEGIRMEIAMLRNERAQLCAGLLGQN